MYTFFFLFVSENQLPNTAVTFGSENSYLLSHPWKSESLSISFRTHHEKALILYQTGTSQNINYFVVAVTSGNIPLSTSPNQQPSAIQILHCKGHRILPVSFPVPKYRIIPLIKTRIHPCDMSETDFMLSIHPL